jgi:hypothetical protein
MSMDTFTAAPRYMVVTDYGPQFGCEGQTYDQFDDACSRYTERMGAGDDSRVYSLAFSDGALTDITAEAVLRVASWLNARNDDLPAWLCAALPSRPAPEVAA